jgi:hypothetical protein
VGEESPAYGAVNLHRQNRGLIRASRAYFATSTEVRRPLFPEPKDSGAFRGTADVDLKLRSLGLLPMVVEIVIVPVLTDLNALKRNRK